MPSRYDLVVLDLDGTLVDSQDILVGLVNETLVAHRQLPAPPRAVAATIGLPLEEVFRCVVPSVGDETIAILCSAYREQADDEAFVRQFRLYEGVAETLAELSAAGVRLGLATSKGRQTTLDILNHCGIASYFDVVLGGDCVERGKPHPEMLLQMRALCGTAPQRTLMVGDTSFDIRMGQAAGVATCAVTYGMHALSALRALEPSFLIDTFTQLATLVVLG